MAKQDGVSAAWARIEKWLARHAPETLGALARGASAAAISRF